MIGESPFSDFAASEQTEQTEQTTFSRPDSEPDTKPS